MKPLNQPLLRNVLLMITICGVGVMITACDDDDGGGNGAPQETGTFSLTTTGDVAYKANNEKRATFLPVDSVGPDTDTTQGYNPEADGQVVFLLTPESQGTPIDSVSFVVNQENKKVDEGSYDIITLLELAGGFQTGSFIQTTLAPDTTGTYVSTSGSIELTDVGDNVIKGRINDVELSRIENFQAKGLITINGEFAAERDEGLATLNVDR